MRLRTFASYSVSAASIGSLLLLSAPGVLQAGELSCLIQPYVVITITSPVGGLLETVAVDRGDLVKEGQILAVLDTSLERATGAVAHAQAKVVMDSAGWLKARPSVACSLQRTA